MIECDPQALGWHSEVCWLAGLESCSKEEVPAAHMLNARCAPAMSN